MYCCAGFQNYVSLAGQSGLGFLAYEQSPGNVAFLIQSRGVAFNDEQTLKPSTVDMKINIASATGLSFCPFCGHRVEDMIREWPDLFSELARKHRLFLGVSFPKNLSPGAPEV